MNILLANDDGIEALGLLKLAEALAEVGTVYVAAPLNEQSAKSHAITIGKDIHLAERTFPSAKEAVTVDGTPADCVKIGLEYYKAKGIDMDAVFSGINHGLNLGTDTLYSGTVGAAVEGAICGLPSAAVSVKASRKHGKIPRHFEYAQQLAIRVASSPLFARRLADKNPRGDWNPSEHALGVDFIHAEHIIVNINVPDLPGNEISGLKVAPLSYREYEEWFVPGDGDEGAMTYHYSGRPHIAGDRDPKESDVIANSLGYATLTPLQFDLTSRRLLEKMRQEFE